MRSLATCLMLVLCQLGIRPASAQDALRTASAAAGAGVSASAGTALHATIGQPFAGRSAGVDAGLGAGQWSQVARGLNAVSLQAQADAAATQEDEPVSVNVLENDQVEGGEPVVVALFTPPAHGTVEPAGDSILVYTPNPDFSGDDAFEYVALSAHGDSAFALVSITVAPVNDAPAFVSIPVSEATAGGRYAYDVAAADVDADALVFSMGSAPGWLTLAGTSDTTARLAGTPPPGEAGQFEVNVSVSDGAIAVTQQFYLTITIVDVLTARPDVAATHEDAPLAIDVLANDAEPFGAPISIHGITEPAHGSAVVRGDSVIVYTPDADFHGDDSFSYTAWVAPGDSVQGDVRVTVSPVNDPPVFTSRPETAAAAGAIYAYEILASDVDADSLAFFALALPEWLTLEGGTEGAAVLSGVANAVAGNHPVGIGVSDGTVSVIQEFTITVSLAAPTAPTPSIPLDAAIDVPLPITLAWEEAPYAAAYQVQVSADSGFESPLVDSTGIEVTSIEISTLLAGTEYYWRVRASNASGHGEWSEVRRFRTASSVSAEDASLPDRFALSQNYPNPFNPSTRVDFSLPEPAHVTVEVYDVLGRHVADLIRDDRPAGRFSVVFEASHLPAGTYIARMRADGFVAVRKMTLLK